MSNAYIGYHIEHKVKAEFSGEFFSTEKPIPIGSILFVISNKAKKKSDKAAYYLEGKYQIVRKLEYRNPQFEDKTAYELKKIISANKLLNLNSMDEFDQITFNNNFTSGGGVREITGNQKYLIEFFNNLLGNDSEASSLELIEDYLDLDTNNKDLSDTERLELKLARIGQGPFRKNTIKVWGGVEMCAVTGIKAPDLLNASHIKPWKECNTATERLSGTNGVMLCVHLDRLFDRFLIGFKKTENPDIRSLVYSPKMKVLATALKEVGIHENLKLDLSMILFSAKHIVEQNLDKHLVRVLEND